MVAYASCLELTSRYSLALSQLKFSNRQMYLTPILIAKLNRVLIKLGNSLTLNFVSLFSLSFFFYIYKYILYHIIVITFLYPTKFQYANSVTYFFLYKKACPKNFHMVPNINSRCFLFKQIEPNLLTKDMADYTCKLAGGNLIVLDTLEKYSAMRKWLSGEIFFILFSLKLSVFRSVCMNVVCV